MLFRLAALFLALVVIPGPSPAAAVSYDAPLRSRLEVVRGFDRPVSAYGPGHRGVDLAAPPGAVITAAAGGVVAFAGQFAGRSLVSVLHADGIRTTYEPLATVDVVRGEPVTGGATLGTLAVGHPGCLATGGEVCLHWGALRGGNYLDPLSLLPDDIVLLPPVPDGPP